eukprot:1266150-Amphidinium_carterae.1
MCWALWWCDEALSSAVVREREAFEASHGAALAFSTRLGLAEAELLGRAEALRKVVLGNRTGKMLNFLVYCFSLSDLSYIDWTCSLGARTCSMFCPWY